MKRRLELARSAIVGLQSRIARLEAGQRQLRAMARGPGVAMVRKMEGRVR
jgi:hypothetical protein